VKDGTLCVVLVQNKSGWRLPGTFVHERETLADAVLRFLRDKAQIEGLRPRQLHVFDAPDRDDRGWVISEAHLVVVPEASAPLTQLRPVSEVHGLVLDHDDIIDLAVRTLRAAYRTAPDPERLLGAEFTLLELLRSDCGRATASSMISTGLFTEVRAGSASARGRACSQGRTDPKDCVMQCLRNVAGRNVTERWAA